MLRTAGAGGYGDPLKRDEEAVRRDVAEGYIGIEKAETGYGVVLDPKTGLVDQSRTGKLRER